MGSQMFEERQKVRDVLSEKIPWMTPKEVIDAEIGIFNATLQFADRQDIVKNWANDRFKNIYFRKAMSTAANIIPTSYVKNETLAERLKAKELKPHDVSFLKPDQSCPEKWAEILKKKEKKEQALLSFKPESMTDQYQCSKCKERQCIYKEIQIRSCDEPMTLFIKCINCGHNWRIG